jgi:hypothetical protein
LHCPAGPSHVDGWGLFPPPFTVVVVVVHPGLPAVQVLVLPPWVELVVVSNPVLFPAANAALEASANESADANTSVEISFVMRVTSFDSVSFRLAQRHPNIALNSVSKTCANPQVIGLMRETNLRHSSEGRLTVPIHDGDGPAGQASNRGTD